MHLWLSTIDSPDEISAGLQPNGPNPRIVSLIIAAWFRKNEIPFHPVALATYALEEPDRTEILGDAVMERQELVRRKVQELLDSGMDYEDIGRRMNQGPTFLEWLVFIGTEEGKEWLLNLDLGEFSQLLGISECL